MNKQSFLRDLESELAGLSPEVRNAALEYCGEFFSGLSPEDEEQVLKSLGSPARLAQAYTKATQKSEEEEAKLATSEAALAAEITKRKARDEVEVIITGVLGKTSDLSKNNTKRPLFVPAPPTEALGSIHGGSEPSPQKAKEKTVTKDRFSLFGKEQPPEQEALAAKEEPIFQPTGGLSRAEEATRVAEAAKTTEAARVAEAAKATEAARVAEAAKATEAARVAEAAKATEAARAARAAEAAKTTEAARVAEAARAARAAEAARVAAVAEAAKSARKKTASPSWDNLFQPAPFKEDGTGPIAASNLFQPTEQKPLPAASNLFQPTEQKPLPVAGNLFQPTGQKPLPVASNLFQPTEQKPANNLSGAAPIAQQNTVPSSTIKEDVVYTFGGKMPSKKPIEAPLMPSNLEEEQPLEKKPAFFSRFITKKTASEATEPFSSAAEKNQIGQEASASAKQETMPDGNFSAANPFSVKYIVMGLGMLLLTVMLIVFGTVSLSFGIRISILGANYLAPSAPRGIASLGLGIILGGIGILCFGCAVWTIIINYKNIIKPIIKKVLDGKKQA